MDTLTRILSRPTAKPYRSRDVEDDGKPYLNDQGQVDFSEGDIEVCLRLSCGLSLAFEMNAIRLRNLMYANLRLIEPKKLVTSSTMAHHNGLRSARRKRHIRLIQPLSMPREHIGRAARLSRSSRSSHNPIPARLRIRTTFLGTAVRVLRQALDILWQLSGLHGFQLPVCVYS